MTIPPRIDSKQRWLWGCCAVAFVVGIGLAWRHIGHVELAKGRTLPIPASDFDRITLDHPFPDRPNPETAPGSLRYGLFKYDADLNGTPLAEEVHPATFNLDMPWVRALLKKHIGPGDVAFKFRMRGQIRVPATETFMHIRSDNGYAIMLRDSTGREAHVDDWENGVTEDFYFKIMAEPGVYDVVIDFSNVQGNAYFDLWSEAADIRFYPAEAGAAATKPGP